MLALYITSGIILFITLALSIPIEITFDIKTHGDTKARVRVGWLFGLVGKDISQRKKKVSRKKAEKIKKTPRKKRKRGLKPFISVLRTKGLPAGILKLARKMLSCLRIRQLDVDLRVGLDDPSDTGMMYGVLWPAFVTLGSFCPIRFRVEPAFDEPVLDLSLQGRVRLFPAQVSGLLLRFVFSLTGLRTLRLMAVSRWKEKS